ASLDDLLGMIPGGVGALSTLATGANPLLGALVGGAAQGLLKQTGMSAFDAPTAPDIVGGLGGEPESWWQNMAAQSGTGPLTYAGGRAAAAPFGRWRQMPTLP